MKGLAAVAEPVGKPAAPARRPEPAAAAAAEPPPKPVPAIVESLEPSVYKFILKHSLRQQVFLLVMTLVSFPFLYYSLDLPKTIVNRAIKDGTNFPQAILGIDFERIPYLLVLCGAFLALVFINGAFKYY